MNLEGAIEIFISRRAVRRFKERANAHMTGRIAKRMMRKQFLKSVFTERLIWVEDNTFLLPISNKNLGRLVVVGKCEDALIKCPQYTLVTVITAEMACQTYGHAVGLIPALALTYFESSGRGFPTED
jgi:hypothetical protein